MGCLDVTMPPTAPVNRPRVPVAMISSVYHNRNDVEIYLPYPRPTWKAGARMFSPAPGACRAGSRGGVVEPCESDMMLFVTSERVRAASSGPEDAAVRRSGIHYLNSSFPF